MRILKTDPTVMRDVTCYIYRLETPSSCEDTTMYRVANCIRFSAPVL